MIFLNPVPIADHDAILGKDFNKKFATFMADFYQPFKKHNLDIQVAKETWEYGVTKGITGATWVGAGKNVVDVKTLTADLDVKGLSCSTISSKQTTEASFLQNNKKQNDGFATLFESGDYSALKTMFVDPILEKIKNTNNLHMLCIVRDKAENEVYYSLLKVEKTSLTDQEFLSKMVADADRGVSVPMIDPAYGKTYIYIPKRRLEVRLNPSGMSTFFVNSHRY